MKKVCLFDNTPFEITDELRKEYLVSCCEEGTDEEVYESFVDKFDDLFENLQYAKDKKGENISNVPVIITGELHLWNGGGHTIEPLVTKDIKSAVVACCKECDYCKIYKENSKICTTTEQTYLPYNSLMMMGKHAIWRMLTWT